MNLTTFAKRLREARETFPMNQKELAKAVGVTPTTISAYEKSDGDNGKKPTLENAQNIASVLGVSLDWLCGLSDTSNKEIRTVDALIWLVQALSCFYFGVDNREAYPDDGSYGTYTEYLLTFCDDRLYEFIKEYQKIESFLNDDVYPEYLKNGLKNALFEKYKNHKIINNRLYSPIDVERMKAREINNDDDYPF